MSNETEREENKQPAEFGSDSSTGQVFNFYLSQLTVLEDLIRCPQVNNAPDRISSFYPLLFSIHSTGLSISILAGYRQLNECYMLSRAFLERLITYMYLLVCDENEYLKYMAHTKQKAFRILKRSIKVGDMTAELKSLGTIDQSRDKELKEAIDLFTSNKGREITRWSSVNLSGMLTIINEKGLLNQSQIGFIMLSFLGIYQDASEALHGTLYGSIFHIGVFEKKLPSSVDELATTYNEKFSTLFLMLGVCIHSLVTAIHNKLNNIEKIHKRSFDNVKSVGGGKWLPPKTKK